MAGLNYKDIYYFFTHLFRFLINYINGWKFITKLCENPFFFNFCHGTEKVSRYAYKKHVFEQLSFSRVHWWSFFFRRDKKVQFVDILFFRVAVSTYFSPPICRLFDVVSKIN